MAICCRRRHFPLLSAILGLGALAIISLVPSGDVALAEAKKVVSTPYGDLLKAKGRGILAELRPTGSPDAKGLSLVCFRLPEDRNYIGVAQFMDIAAPLAKVRGVFDRVTDYVKWWDGLMAIKVEHQDAKSMTLKFTQSVPVPFAPNVETQLVYLRAEVPGEVTYRYHLLASDAVQAQDGMILLKAEGNRTKFVEIDFFKADWGPAQVMGQSFIWTESLRAVYQTDLVMKLRSESDTASDDAVREQSIAAAKAADFASCMNAPKPPPR